MLEVEEDGKSLNFISSYFFYDAMRTVLEVNLGFFD